jgi:hypothetical protein
MIDKQAMNAMPPDTEIRQLRAEIAALKAERDDLKKFFNASNILTRKLDVATRFARAWKAKAKKDDRANKRSGLAKLADQYRRDRDELRRLAALLYKHHAEGGIMHGDAEHQAWLKDYLDKHFGAALRAHLEGKP